MHQLALRVCDCGVLIRAQDDYTHRLLTRAFAGLLANGYTAQPGNVCSYTIDRFPSGAFGVRDATGVRRVVPDAAALLDFIDKEITIGLQRWRSDLFFVHAAVVELDGRVAVLAAPSGTGKSTLTLALVQEGLSYLSDELAPLDPKTVNVHPYARALCLKAPPPAPYLVPDDSVDINGRFHVPLARTAAHAGTLPLGALFVLRRFGGISATCRALTVGSAASHLMANGLNLAAHPTSGLDVAIAVARHVPRYELDSSDLAAACSAVKAVLSNATVAAR